MPRKLPRKRQTSGEYLELQRLMAGAVMLPLAPDGGMRAKSETGRRMEHVAADFIKPNDRLTSFERLEIYNRQYWFRLKDCFYDDYPGVRTVLGKSRFERLACEYLRRHPSESFTLRNLGRRLVGFLEAEPEWAGPEVGLVLDMARLEWAHVEAFDNEAKPPLEIGSIVGADPGRIRLRLQPHITLMQLGHELDRFLIQIKRDEGLRGEASNAMELNHRHKQSQLKRQLRPKTMQLAVHRHNNTVYYKRLQPGQYHLLSTLRAGATLAKGCAALAGLRTVHVTQVKSWFQTWAALGWFCKSE